MRWLSWALMTVLAFVVTASAAVAAAEGPLPGRLVDPRVDGTTITLAFQADKLPDGVRLDPDSVEVTVDGKPAAATAEPFANDPASSRTTVLAIDNSVSMQGDRLASAKTAALTYLDRLPPDVRVGLVTFGDAATIAVRPTADRADVRKAISELTLNTTVGTALYDGATLAAEQTGNVGGRDVLLLTDGNEFGNSLNSLEDALSAARDRSVKLNSVYIGDGQAPGDLTDLIAASKGEVVTSTPAGLDKVFSKFAEAIANQLAVTAVLPAGTAASGNIVVSARADGRQVIGRAFTTFFTKDDPKPPKNSGPLPVEVGATAYLVDKNILPIVLGAFFVGTLVLLYVAFGTFSRDERKGRVRRRLSLYTLRGRGPIKQEETTTKLGANQVARSAVELAGRVVNRRGFDEGLALRLEAAGVPLRAAEWMLIHVGVAVATAVMALLVSGGAILPTILGLALGLGAPYVYLTVKRSRRTSAFLAQLPETLQLVSGSLSAGYSIPQAMDTVVREGSQPMTTEFNRALVEARLGVPIEDAMEGIAERMDSKDFSWVVLAIRIQREVGGNLAELLTTVSETLRERERLRRQVKVLSAEGRLSAWILGLLPIVFTAYLLLVRPAYLQPLVGEALGWLLVGTGVTLLVVGVLWLSRAVKVEV